MTTPTTTDPLLQFTDDRLARPLAPGLRAAREDVLAAVADLRTITDDRLVTPWSWKGGSEEELRYGFYRIAESFELAGIDAEKAQRAAGVDRGRTADLIAPTTAARWDLQGVLLPLPDTAWDADPGNDEWTVRQTLGHVIASQRGYGVGSAWWQTQGLRSDATDLPYAPESIFEILPDEEVEAVGTPTEVRDRLDEQVDRATERLAGLPPERLVYAARWSGFAVDIGFRFGRWSSHLREHTIQVEKTLVMIDWRPSEVDRLVRHVVAAWGRAEATVFGAAEAEAGLRVLAAAAAGARVTATKLAGLTGG